MYAALYGETGQAWAELERLEAVVAGSGLVDPATVEAEAGAVRDQLDTLAAGGPDRASAPAEPAPPAASPATE